jgi:NADH-quinone oxidoreductase subunit C
MIGELQNTLQEKFTIAESIIVKNELRMKIMREELLSLCQFLSENTFDHLSCITGIDFIEYLQVVYHLFSYEKKFWVVLKVDLQKDDPHVPTVYPVWPVADWLERETYDLVGIIFDGHPDMRRILLPESWKGHPLRKDYVDENEIQWGEVL